MSSTEQFRSGSFVDGTLTPAGSGGTFEHVNPATGAVQATVALAGKAEVDRAVESARAAFPEWRQFSAADRRDVLLRVRQLVIDHRDELGELTSLENGTPISFARASGPIAASWFGYYAGWADKVEGRTITTGGAAGLNYTLAEPYGVIAIIIPWNGPLASIGMKVPAALAAGNCVVIKPPDVTPFTSVRFAELCIEAGIPPGVVNVLPGGAEAGDALVRHRGVDKISFTGGTSTATLVLQGAAENRTPTVLELGGKSANIIFDDAALDAAIPSAIWATSVMSGQVCAFGSRLLVQDTIYDACVEQAAAVAEGILIGDPLDESTLMGPLVSARHCERVEGMIDRAKSDGAAHLVTGGSRLGGSLGDGYFVPPTVFADVDPSSELARDEVFGPVLAITRFGDAEEAIRLANDTRYGLAGYVWTRDLRRAHETASQLEAGTILVNNSFYTAPPSIPFGGVRDSGHGREGGEAGFLECLRTKSVQVSFN